MTQHDSTAKWIRATIVATGLVLAAGSASAQRVNERQDLQTMARAASTTAEHASVARQYRLEGEAFAAKASEHEANVNRMTKSAGSIMHKWPSMAPGALRAEKDLAMAARRSSEESFRLADHHLRLSVESLADAQPGSRTPATR